jgi:hypothetical protein
MAPDPLVLLARDSVEIHRPHSHDRRLAACTGERGALRPEFHATLDDRHPLSPVLARTQPRSRLTTSWYRLARGSSRVGAGQRRTYSLKPMSWQRYSSRHVSETGGDKARNGVLIH